MTPTVQLRWQYSPADLFEGPLEIKQAGYDVSVDSDNVVATIEQAALEADQGLRGKVERHVANLFLGVQLESQKAYDLSRPSVTNLKPDGSKGVVIECLPGHIKFTGHRPDIRYTREDGTIVDTKAERVQRRHMFAELAARLGETDETLTRMLRSYDTAIRDPNDELVHLYEVRDSLVARFGSKAVAILKLRLSQIDWSRLGELCNTLPLKQGRHRGKTNAALRDATEYELTEARLLATALIEAYMKYIDPTP